VPHLASKRKNKIPVALMGECALSTEPNELWRLPVVKAKTGLSRAAVYAKALHEDFPKPIKLGRTSAWISGEVQQWIDARIAEARGGAR
jgi:prophage regulatory protein